MGVRAAVGTGLCAALTTYSTFGYETIRLLQEHARLFAARWRGRLGSCGCNRVVIRVSRSDAFWRRTVELTLSERVDSVWVIGEIVDGSGELSCSHYPS
jgi:hypothetical protein